MVKRAIAAFLESVKILILAALFLLPPRVLAVTFDVAAGDVYGPNGLVAVINAANANTEADTINLASGSTYTLTAVDNVFVSGPNGLPLIRSEIIINGNGATVQRDIASTLFRIFQVDTPGKLTLNGLTVSNGYSQYERGGGVSNYGILTVNNSTISNNFGAYGGGVSNEANGILVVKDSNFTGNRTDNAGGGVYIEGNSNASIDSSTFSRNISGLGSVSNKGTLNITNSTFAENETTIGLAQGGGLFNYEGGTANIMGSTFSGNIAQNIGGGIYNARGSTVSVDNSKFFGNNSGIAGGLYNDPAATTTVNNSQFLNNRTSQGGGIINHGTLTITGSIVSGNSVSGGFLSNGGGIYNGSSGNITINNTNIASNSATVFGGGIYNEGAVNLNGDTIDENIGSGTFGGGAIYNQLGSIYASGTSFSNNIAPFGGAIWNNGGSLNFDKTTFMGNRTSDTQNYGYGGGILNDNLGSLTITNSSFSNNIAHVGGALANTSSGLFSVTTSVFTGNSAVSGQGGSIGNFNINATVSGNCIVGNTSQSVYNGDYNYILDATNSWWGTASGPTHSSNPSGTGDSVSDYVNFTPWLTSPPNFCPGLYLGRVLTSLSPAQAWVGLKNSDDIGIKFDLKAEVYKGIDLIGSGELTSVPGGSSGFNNAKLNSIPLALTVPVPIQSGDQLSIKLYVRNACSGSGKNSGAARLWYNDSAANSHFDATIDAIVNNYYLLDGFLLGLNPGLGPKKTIDIAAGSKCSPFKLFGTWNTTL